MGKSVKSVLRLVFIGIHSISVNCLYIADVYRVTVCTAYMQIMCHMLFSQKIHKSSICKDCLSTCTKIEAQAHLWCDLHACSSVTSRQLREWLNEGPETFAVSSNASGYLSGKISAARMVIWSLVLVRYGILSGECRIRGKVPSFAPKAVWLYFEPFLRRYRE